MDPLILSLRYRHYHQNMTRATRVALWSTTFVIAYILAFFQFVQVPFLSKEHAEQILPVVSPVILLPLVPDAHNHV